MDWRDIFGKAYKLTADTLITGTASACNTVGSLACMLGGAGFTSSFALDEAFSATAYGSADAKGDVDLNVLIKKYNYDYNQTIPLDKFKETNTTITVELHDYLKPDHLRVVSSIMIIAGLLLRSMGANLNQFQQGKMDNRFFKKHHPVDIRESSNAMRSPSNKEYFYTNADSFYSSLTYILFSSAVLGMIIDYSGLMGSTRTIGRYPFSSEYTVNDSFYDGPVAVKALPFSGGLNHSSIVNLPIVGNLSVSELIRVNGTADLRYGLTLRVDFNSTPDFAVGLPIALGIAAFMASNFFAKKAQEERDDRVIEQTYKQYVLVD